MATTQRAGRSSRFRTPVNTRRSARSQHRFRTQPRAIALAVGTALLPLFNAALADPAPTTVPTNGKFTDPRAGKVNPVQTGSWTANLNGQNRTFTTRLQVDQNANAAVINWDSFSLGSDAWLNFSQPSASATTLNLIAGAGGRSEIFGRLTA